MINNTNFTINHRFNINNNHQFNWNRIMDIILNNQLVLKSKFSKCKIKNNIKLSFHHYSIGDENHKLKWKMNMKWNKIMPEELKDLNQDRNFGQSR